MKKLTDKRILIVEDDAMMRETLGEFITDLGARVEMAENGSRALDILQTETFDAVISDIRMPGGDGLSLVKKINETFTIRPLVFLCSGYSDLKDSDYLALNVAQVFEKPFNMNHLVEALEVHLAKA